MKITSPAFTDGDAIPMEYTRDGADKSPPLNIEDVPSGAKSLALIVDDPDAPSGTFTHWILFNISPTTKEIHEDSPPVMATQGRNDWNEIQYGGPKPPSGEHRYFFRLYALDSVLTATRGAKRKELDDVMAGHVMEESELMGRYASGQFAGAR